MLFAQALRPTQHLPLGLCTGQSGLGPLDQQVALKLSYRGYDAHRHFSGWACKIDTAQRQAMHADPQPGQSLDGRSHVHGIAAEPVELGHHQDVTGFQFVQQLPEASALRRRHRPGDGLLNRSLRFDVKAGGGDLLDLVVGVLLGGRNPAVGKNSGHKTSLCVRKR